MNNLIDIFKIIIQAGVIGGILTYMKDNKSNELSHITSERKEWREDIRNIADELDKRVFLTDILNILSKLKTRINQYGMNYNNKNLNYLQDEHIWEKIDEIEWIKKINEIKSIILEILNKLENIEELKDKNIEKLKELVSRFSSNIEELNIYFRLRDYDNILKSKQVVVESYKNILLVLEKILLSNENKILNNYYFGITEIKNKLKNIDLYNSNYLTSKNKIVKYLHLMLKHDWERSKQEVTKNRILFASAISYGISMLFYYINNITNIKFGYDLINILKKFSFVNMGPFNVSYNINFEVNNIDFFSINNIIILDLLKNLCLYGITFIAIIVFSSKISSICELLLLNLLFFIDTKNMYMYIVIVMLFIIMKCKIIEKSINYKCVFFVIIMFGIVCNKIINFEFLYKSIFSLPYLLLFYYSYLEYKLNSDYIEEIEKIK